MYHHFDLDGIVAGIQAGDESSVEQLYLVVQKSCRRWIIKALGRDARLDDCLQDVFMTVWGAISRKELRISGSLINYIRMIAYRKMASIIHERIEERKSPGIDYVMEHVIQHDIELPGKVSPIQDISPDPEALMLQNERRRIARQALAELRADYRDILVRFYLEEQSWQRICAEMDLTPTQYRLLKSRAKEKFGQVGKRILNKQDFGLKLAA